MIDDRFSNLPPDGVELHGLTKKGLAEIGEPPDGVELHGLTEEFQTPPIQPDPGKVPRERVSRDDTPPPNGGGSRIPGGNILKTIERIIRRIFRQDSREHDGNGPKPFQPVRLLQSWRALSDTASGLPCTRQLSPLRQR
jgi:hypothetical protein